MIYGSCLNYWIEGQKDFYGNMVRGMDMKFIQADNEMDAERICREQLEKEGKKSDYVSISKLTILGKNGLFQDANKKNTVK